MEPSGKEGEGVWKIFMDGSITNQGSGVGILLISPQQDEIHVAMQLSFTASNNEAEYVALLASLRVCDGGQGHHSFKFLVSNLPIERDV